MGNESSQHFKNNHKTKKQTTNHSQKNQNQNSTNMNVKLQTYETLLSMGFDEIMSWKSINQFDGNIDKCIEHMLSHQNKEKPDTKSLVTNDVADNQCIETKTVSQLLPHNLHNSHYPLPKAIKNNRSQILELINNGFSTKEAVDAVIMSTTQYDNICVNSKMDMNEIVNYLLHLEFNFPQAIAAAVQSQYDVNKALLLLINRTITAGSTNNKSLPVILNQSIQRLISMGYSDKAASMALRHTKDMSEAVEVLLQEQCNGCITECKHLKRLGNVLNKYQIRWSDSDIDIKVILDDFNHLLFNHNDNNDFKHIYDTLDECNVRMCDIIKRHYRNRNIDSSATEDEIKENSEMQYIEIIDKIHCHYHHSYDMGLRGNMFDEKHHDQHQEKHCAVNSEINIYQQLSIPDALQKFTQLAVKHYNMYNFGEKFYYWPYFKNCYENDFGNFAYKYNERYTPPKYLSLKEELLKNEIAILCLAQWKNEYNKAAAYVQTRYSKTLTAEPRNDYNSPGCNTFLFGIKEGTVISLNHILSMIVYCAYSHLSYKFSETFRKLNNGKEDENSLIQRHRNFHHLSKHIIEAVHLFSKQSHQMEIKTFYHGISTKTVFDGIKCVVDQPFSTTSSWEVAVNFGTNVGMVLALDCGVGTRYFDCAWLSDFSNERELLFIGRGDFLTIFNITHLSDGSDFESFVIAIGIIDSMTNAAFYQHEHNISFLNQYNSGSDEHDPLLFGGSNINGSVKYLTIRLIKHQLSKYKPESYESFSNIHPYIDTLLHNVCIKKKNVLFDMAAMNVETIKKYKDGGYQGYLFLKNLFFESNSFMHMIKLDFVKTLFTNVKIIGVKNIGQPLVTSTERILMNVLRYLKNNNQKFVVQIYFIYGDGISEMIPNTSSIEINKLVHIHQKEFEKINWVVVFHQCKLLFYNKVGLHQGNPFHYLR
eukprot:224706_1